MSRPARFRAGPLALALAALLAAPAAEAQLEGLSPGEVPAPAEAVEAPETPQDEAGVETAAVDPATQTETMPDPGAEGEGISVTTAAMNMPAWMDPENPPPRPRRRVPPTCSEDGGHCIAPISYTRDVCKTIESTATEAGLDSGFFARLIWQESLFDAYAVSPAGALGIAQFIPSTAKMRGLKDPFNPAAALQASAQYLAYLRDTYGSLGMAAIAYNGGEQRAADFRARRGGLMPETRNYVKVITGLSAEAWRDSKPASLDLALDNNKPFLTACLEMAANRGTGRGKSLGWMMIYAADPNRIVVERRAEQTLGRFASIIGEGGPDLRKTRLPGRPQSYFVATVLHQSEGAARKQCDRLRRAGGGCMVLRE